jgi:alpha,alpha-trehalase
VDEIMAAYRAESPKDVDALHAFVHHWFEFPVPRSDVHVATGLSLGAHIEALWPQLVRSDDASNADISRLPLPAPYIVPGGIFRESYYWDTYFSLIGLGPDHRELVASMVQDFAHLIDTVGHIPNGNRTYYLSRSQPPFFALIVGLLDPRNPARAHAQYLPQLRREHAFWMDGEATLAPASAHRRVVCLPDGTVLNRYWDDTPIPRDEAYPKDVELAEQATGRTAEDVYRNVRAACESGWDFSSRWFDDHASMTTINTTSVAPVDLNTLLYMLESAIAAGAREVGDEPLEREFAARGAARAAALHRCCWNETLGVFDDVDLRTNTLRGNLTPAGLFPMFADLATPVQVARMAATTQRTLLAEGGLLSSALHTGQQWDAPNGWAPLQWIAVDGFDRHGQGALADRIAERWLATVERVFRETGRLVEKYDVVTARPGGGGEYALQDGFGWTNGVSAALLRRRAQSAG